MAKETIRRWHVDEVLSSVDRATAIMLELTEGEVLAALEIESNSRRRKSMLRRLIGRAARIHELDYVAKLKVRYRYATQEKRNP